MAIGDDVVSNISNKIVEGDVQSNRPVSAAIMNKFGAIVNGLIDQSYYEIVFEIPGYIPVSGASSLAFYAPIFFPPVALPGAFVINYYSLSFASIGATGTACSINFDRYDTVGGALGSMFTDGTLAMTATVADQLNPTLWWDNRGISTTTGSVNTSNITTGIPTPVNTTFPGEYYLKPRIVTMAAGVRNLRMVMRFNA